MVKKEKVYNKRRRRVEFWLFKLSMCFLKYPVHISTLLLSTCIEIISLSVIITVFKIPTHFS